MRRQHTVAQWKIKEVEYLSNLLREYKTIGITSMTNMPSKQIQEIRKKLRKKALIKMARGNLMKIALDRVSDVHPGIDKLKELITGQVAFILSQENPVSLSFILQKNKIPAPAKPGQIAPKDIIVPPKDTGIAPGPFISELHEVGLETKIEGGTIHIAKETVVAKKGDVISEELASVLKRLGIEPMELGLELLGAYTEGIILPREILSKELEEYENEIKEASLYAFNLALNAGIPTPETTPYIIAKAYMEAIAVAIETGIFTVESAPYILSAYYAKALALAQKLAEVNPEITPDELKQVSASQPKPAEEKKEIEEKEEERKEEEEIGGLADLFG
ncbi:MAG: 50S ribosomal protein L10 [Candidatus Asgardarchaeia archaeon]